MIVDQNNDDQPLSSEELLRRARQGLGESSATPPADFSIESYPPPAPDLEDAAVAEPGELGDALEAEPDLVASSFPVPDDTPPAPIEDLPRSEGVGSWAPPPVDSQEAPPWASGPAPQPTSAPARRVNFGRIVAIVVGIFVIGSVLINFFDSSKTVDEIAIGDCMDIPEGDEFSTIDPIDCAEPHDLEVYAVLDIATQSSEFAVTAPYPGDNPLYEAALEYCLEPFEAYVGSEYELSTLWIDAFTPTVEGWEEFDDREIQCVLLQLNPELTDIVKSNRSFRNSGL